jgi:hydrogenase nickel incorporation protein HypA/HybF
MHELSIAMNILEMAKEEASRQGGGEVLAIHLRLGPLSGILPAALQSAYDLARNGSALASAKLVIQEVPLVAYCSACCAERNLESPWQLCCPTCGTPTPEIVRGRELEVTALEIAS